MRLESLTLERYGAFTERRLDFDPEARLHVVLGANESGKTSALAAISDLLFGFGHLTPYDFEHEAKTLRIGATVLLRDGARLSFRRRKGNKNTLVDAADQPLADDLLSASLGGLSRDTFQSEFGLTTQALRDGGRELLRAGGRFAETLAASSAGLTALSRLRETLDAEADALFTPRKSGGKAFYLALERHDAADKRLREAVVTADALASADAAITDAEARVAALTGEHAEAGRSLSRLRRSVRTRPKLARLTSLAEALETFADLPPAAPETLAGWRKALAGETEIGEELARLDEADAADRAAIAALAIDEPVLATGGDIDALRERLGAVRKAIDDLPRRSEARRQAQHSLDESARRLGLASHVELLAAIPTDLAQAKARDLIAAQTLEGARRREAKSRLEQAKGELERLLKDDAGAIPIDPEPYRQRLDAVSDVPGDVARLQRDASACDAEQRTLEDLARALDPAAGDVAALAALVPPDESRVAAVGNARDQIDAALAASERRLHAATHGIEAAETMIAQLARDGASATKADLTTARSGREAAMDRLGAALDDDAPVRRARFDDARSLSHAVDDIADRLLADTALATRRQAAEDRRLEASEERQQALDERAALEAQRAAIETRWMALWAPCGIVPRAPADMARWREKAEGLRQRRRELTERRQQCAALANAIEANRAALADWLRAQGREVGAALPAEALYREARFCLEGMRTAWTKARTSAVARAGAERAVAEENKALAKADQALAALAAQWPDAAAPIGVGPKASPAEAEAALGVWHSIVAPRQNFEREGRSVEGIEHDLATFRRDVADLAQRVAPQLTGADARKALDLLSATLSEARSASTARAHMLKAAGDRQRRRLALAARRETLTAPIDQAKSALLAPSIDALAIALERCERRSTLLAERSNLERDLAEIADGLDEDVLRAEQTGIDIDALPGEIERLDARQKRLLDEIGDASANRLRAVSERDALALGRDAIGAARDREEARADLISVAESWLARAAAARLATRAIERHRSAAQDPVIARASALFNVATAKAFSGLGADYDDTDMPVLVAVRSNGRRVKVDGLSEGTRDQLFLALRLALLEQRAGDPLPFIGDDLFASFDEQRTRQSLALLADYGRDRQAILFTHHTHVAELAKSFGGSAIEVIAL